MTTAAMDSEKISLAEIQSLARAEQDVMAGNVMAAEDVHDYYEKKYPWLCE